MKMLPTILLTTAINALVFAYLTNPAKEEHQMYVAVKVQQISGGNSLVGGGAYILFNQGNVIDRKNYFIFSRTLLNGVPIGWGAFGRVSVSVPLLLNEI
jgi:hypothetical protein